MVQIWPSVIQLTWSFQHSSDLNSRWLQAIDRLNMCVTSVRFAAYLYERRPYLWLGTIIGLVHSLGYSTNVSTCGPRTLSQLEAQQAMPYTYQVWLLCQIIWWVISKHHYYWYLSRLYWMKYIDNSNLYMPFYQYRISHYKDSTAPWPSYLYNRNRYTGNTVSLYWSGRKCCTVFNIVL